MRILFSVMLLSLFSAAAANDLQIPVQYDTLGNGLRVIIVPDTNVAVVSCRLYYFVGSMYEGPGTTGLSHMYEHMMFKGTKRLGTKNYQKEIPIMRSIDSLAEKMEKEKLLNREQSDSLIQHYRAGIFSLLEKQRNYIKKDEIWELYQNNGGTSLNAWTSDDMTAYIVTLPKNKVELFYWIEADRMRNPVLREFYSERDVIAEERRMRYDNRPVNRYWERLNSLFYVAHPYRNPTIGWMSDIQSYTREKMESHVRRYYTPDNALLVLVGNIDSKKAMKDIKTYFGTIPRASVPKQEVVTREPEPVGVTRFTMHEQGEPRIDMLFHTPGYPNDDLYKLDIVEGIFSGRSGRLYRRLVDKEGLCTNAGAQNNFRIQDGEFHVWAELKNDADPEKVEQIIIEELRKIANEKPSGKEMMRITNEIRMSFVSGLKSLEGISDRLAYFERLRSWRDLLTYPEKIAALKPDEIPDAAKKWLDPEKMTIGRLLPVKTKEPVKNQPVKK
ncbi:MAG TPA: pitrilysin family protein [Chitinispirillaceae bacterium]|jgi:predicted Zn-dependent peptidase|nr:pitrilysin family protein [Chitinispirillaceae bacterium]